MTSSCAGPPAAAGGATPSTAIRARSSATSRLAGCPKDEARDVYGVVPGDPAATTETRRNIAERRLADAQPATTPLNADEIADACRVHRHLWRRASNSAGMSPSASNPAHRWPSRPPTGPMAVRCWSKRSAISSSDAPTSTRRTGTCCTWRSFLSANRGRSSLGQHAGPTPPPEPTRLGSPPSRGCVAVAPDSEEREETADAHREFVLSHLRSPVRNPRRRRRQRGRRADQRRPRPPRFSRLPLPEGCGDGQDADSPGTGRRSASPARRRVDDGYLGGGSGRDRRAAAADHRRPRSALGGDVRGQPGTVSASHGTSAQGLMDAIGSRNYSHPGRRTSRLVRSPTGSSTARRPSSRCPTSCTPTSCSCSARTRWCPMDLP